LKWLSWKLSFTILTINIMVKKLNEEQFEHIFQVNRENDRIDPGSQIWNRLEDKLDLNDNKKTKRLYRNWAIAASFLVLLTASALFTFFIQHENSNHFASNGNHPMNMEDLGSAEIHFAELSNVTKLYNAYAVLEAQARNTEESN
jgi:hypothetical protein